MNTPCSSSSSCDFSVPTAELGELGQEMAEFFATGGSVLSQDNIEPSEWDLICANWVEAEKVRVAKIANMTVAEMDADVDRMF
jgi:hypothetical protein